MAVIDNLIAYWSLDEASGNAIDAHGANDLTETSGTIGSGSGANAKVGTSRDFASADTEYFELADNADLSTGDIDFTFAAWINYKTIGSFPVLAHKGWPGPDVNAEWVVYHGSRFVFEKCGSGANTSVAATNAGATSTGTWYFVVAIHDSVNNQIRISANDSSETPTSTSTGVNNGNRVFQLGASSGQSLYSNAYIDEAAFWKKALTTAEITWLYNSGNGRSYADIVAEAGGGGGGQPTTKRWGGVSHMGTQKLRGGHGGGPWGRTRDGLYVPNHLIDRKAA